MFPQDHQPGHLGAFDFTHCEELGVTIAGVIRKPESHPAPSSSRRSRHSSSIAARAAVTPPAMLRNPWISDG